MVAKIIVKICKYPVSKLTKLNKAVEVVLALPERVDNFFTYSTKIGGAIIGGGNFGKGCYDIRESLYRCDYLCASVSSVGAAADLIQTCTSFLPGANYTAAITLPISCSCKIFVYCCKSSEIFRSLCLS